MDKYYCKICKQKFDKPGINYITGAGICPKCGVPDYQDNIKEDYYHQSILFDIGYIESELRRHGDENSNNAIERIKKYLLEIK